jgi:hypothetical protein
MVTRLGEQFIYNNCRLGAAKDEEDDTQIYISVADPDNQEIHLIPLKIDNVEQYCQLIKQTAMGQKVEIVSADRMPR